MMGFSGKTLLNIERLVCNHTVVGTYRLFDEHGVLVKSINQKSILEFVKSPQSLRKSLFKDVFLFLTLAIIQTHTQQEIMTILL